MDWHGWHDLYDIPDSPMAQRLKVVQDQIRFSLDNSPSGPLRIISICAGQGRDLLGVLPGHPRVEDVKALLVDLDERNTVSIHNSASDLGLSQVEVLTGDASLTDNYAAMAPADIVLMCGVFGNITEEDIERCVSTCTQLCKRGGRVIWTRHRRLPDRVPQICKWFEGHGFDEELSANNNPDFGIVTHRFSAETQPLIQSASMFSFVGSEALRDV
ncbi:MAG: methyltransferase domain-containing protein [Alphaproteobacteria bacterium]|nr:methyltransferase domain-containing protein [Alphaproteobacteria bacterium]